ncbi:TPA: hypothetical protein DDY33_00620 [Candidatus Nomurabacteria bacterium]|nr:hypothetical protein [Candidatus Nomurabacteria bacterium]HCT85511.1 hypothetical protein [Candidatus Margulisiibacteriota bacterium]
MARGSVKNEPRICRYCGEEFIALNPRKIYCSVECSNNYNNNKNYNREIYNKICVVCGKYFTTTHPNIINCSAACRSKAIKTYNKNEIKKCIYCGELFMSSPVQKLCSTKCGNRYNAEKKLASKKIEKKCLVAGIDTSKTHYEYDNLLFKNISIRTTTNLGNKLREEILSRDNNKCYICGNNTDLHVHHIIPRKFGGPHIAENLVTLCAGCHRSVESGNVDKAVKSCVRRFLSSL